MHSQPDNVTNREPAFYQYFFHLYIYVYSTVLMNKLQKSKGKAIPLQAWTGPQGSRKLRLPDFQTRHQPPLPPRRYRWYSFLLDLLFRITSLKNPIRNRTRDLPVCSTVPQPIAPPRTPTKVLYTLLVSPYFTLLRIPSDLNRLRRFMTPSFQT